MPINVDQVQTEACRVQPVGLTITITTPYLTTDEYARLSGMSPRHVRDLVQRGKLPTRPRSHGHERVYINNALLLKQALEAGF